jgi:hypothetical protein
VSKSEELLMEVLWTIQSARGGSAGNRYPFIDAESPPLVEARRWLVANCPDLMSAINRRQGECDAINEDVLRFSPLRSATTAER